MSWREARKCFRGGLETQAHSRGWYSWEDGDSVKGRGVAAARHGSSHLYCRAPEAFILPSRCPVFHGVLYVCVHACVDVHVCAIHVFMEARVLGNVLNCVSTLFLRRVFHRTQISPIWVGR